MTISTFYPAVSADDGYAYPTTQFYTNTEYASVAGGGNDAFVRFPNVTIPSGATISTCYMTIYTRYIPTNPVIVDVHFNDVVDAVAPTSRAELTALSLTPAVPWNSSWPTTWHTAHNTPSLVSDLQDIIDKPGWNSDQAVMVVMKDNGDDYGQFYMIDYSSGIEKAVLYVEWTLPPAYEVEGYIYEKGVPVSRHLYIYDSSDGSLANSTTSSGNGYYYMTVTTSGSHFIVCVDDEEGDQYNDLIMGRVFPDEVI